MIAARLPKRFTFVRELGRGGMGAVYEAVDTEGGARVAIKTLPSHDPMAIARFKREFRALADLHHPNLVALGELFCEEGEWAFSMDLIEGADLLEYVWRTRGDGRAAAAPDRDGDDASLLQPPSARGDEVAERGANAAAQGGASPAPSLPHSYDEERLRSAFTQLAHGLEALHHAGKIHRDIKPSNVRVRTDGQAFLLDFGLVTDLTNDGTLTGHQNVVGTVAYAAPEQASGGTIGTFSDWYSVGVVLFEALTGRLPFEGNPMQIVVAKTQNDAPRARDLVPSVPQDLDAICARLLQFDPSKRPSPESVCRALEGARSTARPNDTLGSIFVPFVGRKEQLALLDRAFAKVAAGEPAAVVLEGESGTGKTSLARRFLDRTLIDHNGAVVVAGRCYENEAVPYNAWDSALDSLAAHWARLEATDAALLLPLHVDALAQTFPALRRVPAVARRATPTSAKLDPREVRSRAFSALRDVFVRLAQRAELIVCLDDIQWADHDSVSLLAEVLREPEPPPFLLIATARPLCNYPVLERELGEVLPRRTERCVVSELPHEDALELATLLLGRRSPEAIDHAERIATEAGGHALFIGELVEHLDLSGSETRGALSLADALWSRVLRLPDVARSLLTVLAVAARPIPEDVALRAAGVAPTDAHRVLSALRTGHLSRSSRVESTDRIETYHDRIRHVVFERTAEATRSTVFEQLALAFEGTAHGDSSLLAEFWASAGDHERAGRHARVAGDAARAALAFDRAAAFYETALDRPSCTDEERHELLLTLADTLAKAGRGKEAADVFQRALGGARGEVEALELDHKTCEQLLRTGYFDEGTATAKRVLARVGVTWPDSTIRAVLTLVGLRAFLALRGQWFRSRSESAIAPQELARVDVCASIGHWLQIADTMRAFVFILHQVRLALRSGEIGRISRAMSMETARSGVFNGGRGGARVRKLEKQVAYARSLALQTNRPYEIALADGALGAALVASCRARDGVASLERGEAAFREMRTNTSEVVSAQIWAFRGYFYLGAFATHERRHPAVLQEAYDRRDLYGTTNLRIGFPNFAWLVRDDPDTAARSLREGLLPCLARPFSAEHHYARFAATNIFLYVGDARRALAEIDEEWVVLERSYLRRISPGVRFQSSEYRARAYIASARESGALRRERLARARTWTQDVGRASYGYAPATAQLLRAQIASVAGDEVRAVGLLRQSIAGLRVADLPAYEAIAQRALGKTLKGEEGADLVSRAEAFLREQAVRNIPALCVALAPGFAGLE